MSSNTPRKISLRRKRLNNEVKKDGPPTKRMSPSFENQTENEAKVSKSDFAENMKKPLQIPNSKATSLPPTTPKNSCRLREKRGLITPTGADRGSTSSFGRGNEDSSYSPFTSSQIPSTQDCEVVWDCNSPGYSKEDLKKMSGDRSCSPSPIAPVQHRVFARLRPPMITQNRIGAKNSKTVADELDSLLTKVNMELMKQMDIDNSSEDESTLPNLNINLLDVSSQPFDVSDLEQNISVADPEIALNACPSLSKKRLDSPIDKEEKEDCQRRVTRSVQKKCLNRDSEGYATPFSVRRLGSETNCDSGGKGIEKGTKDFSFSSADDDLFNESFLKSTQALEDALFNKETGKFDTPSPLNQKKTMLSPLSRIRRKKPTILFSDTNDNPHEGGSKDKRIPSLSLTDMVEKCDRSNKKQLNPLPVNKKEDERKIVDPFEPVSPSPIISKGRKSPVARGFLSDGAKNEAKIGHSDSLFNPSTSQLKEPFALKKEETNVQKPTRLRASFQLGLSNATNEKTSLNFLLGSSTTGAINQGSNKPQDIFKPSQNSFNKFNNSKSLSKTNSTSGNETGNVGFKRMLRSNSGTSSGLTNSLKKTNSCDFPKTLAKSNSASYETFTFSQELDDDDDIFASLIPTLMEVEAEHANTLSQCIKKGSQKESLFKSKILSHNNSRDCNNKIISDTTNLNGESPKVKKDVSIKAGSLNVPNINRINFNEKKSTLSKTSDSLVTNRNLFGGQNFPKTDTKDGINGQKNLNKNVNPIFGENPFPKSSYKPTESLKYIPAKPNTNDVINNSTLKRSSFSLKSNSCASIVPSSQLNRSKGNAKTDNEASSSNSFLPSFSTSFPPPPSLISSNPFPLPLPSSSIQTTSTIKQKTVNATKDTKDDDLGFDDDDDDIFMQDDVLEYISLVESEYAASQTQKRVTAPEAVRFPVSQFEPSKKATALPNTKIEPRKSSHVKTNNQTSKLEDVKTYPKSQERRKSHSFDTSFESLLDTSNDTMNFVKKELLKVGQTANKINDNFKNMPRFNDSPKRTNVGASKSNLNESISNEDFLNTAFEENLFEDSFTNESLPIATTKIHHTKTNTPRHTNNYSKLPNAMVSQISRQGSQLKQASQSSQTNNLNQYNPTNKRLGTLHRINNSKSSSGLNSNDQNKKWNPLF